MTDLIFHVGFPKCASTTFQEIVFPIDRGYLGTSKELSGSMNFAKQFQNFSPLGVKVTGNLKQAEKWKRKILTYKNNQSLDVNRFIISSEFFTQKNKIKDRPIIKFLKTFNEKIWDAGDVKIIVVIRNQAEKMASGYAETSNTIPDASQADFIEYVNRYLRKHGPLMDYSTWIDEFQVAFGVDNVLVLLMEDIGEVSFWMKLKTFCDLQEFEPESMLHREPERVKRLEKYRWTIQSFDSEFKAKVWANNSLKLIWPHHIKKDLREKIRLGFIKKLTAFYESSLYNSDSGERETQITLTAELQQQIKNHYRSSNMRLSELLDRDLTKLGY